MQRFYYQLTHLPPVVAMAIGSAHALFVTASGELYSVGNNGDGQLGVLEAQKRQINLVTVPSASKVIAIAAGAHHSMCLTDNGSVYSWGWSDSGRLGHGKEDTSVHTPKKIEFLSDKNIVAIAGGSAHSAAITENGQVYVWGWANKGRLGVPGRTVDNFYTPTLLSIPLRHSLVNDFQEGLLSNFTTDVKAHAIALGGSHSLLLTEDGDLWTWGDNSRLQQASEWTIPKSSAHESNYAHIFIPGTFEGNVIGIAAGESHSLVLTDKGEVYEWGAVRGHTSSRPQKVDALKEIVAIATQKFISYALNTSREIFYWGTNEIYGPVTYAHLKNKDYNIEHLMENDDNTNDNENENFPLQCFSPWITHLHYGSPYGPSEVLLRIYWKKSRDLWIGHIKDFQSPLKNLPRDIINLIQLRIFSHL